MFSVWVGDIRAGALSSLLWSWLGDRRTQSWAAGPEVPALGASVSSSPARKGLRYPERSFECFVYLGRGLIGSPFGLAPGQTSENKQGWRRGEGRPSIPMGEACPELLVPSRVGVCRHGGSAPDCLEGVLTA